MISASMLSIICLSILDSNGSRVYNANILASIIDDSTASFISDLILFNLSASGNL